MRTLKSIKPGATVRVAGVSGGGSLKRRIMEMGIVKGVDITVRRLAPLGDPLEISVRGYSLSIRKADADIIKIV